MSEVGNGLHVVLASRDCENQELSIEALSRVDEWLERLRSLNDDLESLVIRVE